MTRVAHCDDEYDESADLCSFMKTEVCGEGQFPCPNERKCLNSTFVCDGKFDCEINSIDTRVLF